MVETGAQLGPYRLLRRIGAGGMAEVFLAQRIGAEGFARTVAVKTILTAGGEEEGVGLFLDEARVAAYLEHAAIVQTVDLGFENDTLFIVMEYVPGPALSRVIRDLKKMNRFIPAHVVAFIGTRVASALDYAHRRATTPDGKLLQLIHRDVSPQNILLTRTGMVKLTDFGVARASIQMHKTRTGQVRGKAMYMAPEQVRAGPLDGRTDVFALGLVLYETLTGIRVYQRKTDIMSMRAILTDEVAPIRDVNPSVPDDLVDVIKRALAKKPHDRFDTAHDMADALARTYRRFSDTALEAEVIQLIDELFGPEQFANERESVPIEGWQPTVTAQAGLEGDGSNPTPQRITGAKLSPKIAAMLKPPESTADEGDITQSDELSSDVRPSQIVAQVRASGRKENPAEMLISEPSLPGEPVLVPTNPRAFAELRSPPQAVSSPLSVPDLPPSRGVWTWVLVGLLGFIAAVLAAVISAKLFHMDQPTPSDPKINGVAAVEAPSTPKAAARAEAKTVPEPPPEQLEETHAEPKRTKHREKKVEADKTEVDHPEETKDAFVKRATAVQSRLRAQGSDAMAGQIGHLLNEILMFGHELTPEDRDLIRRAEAELKHP